MWLHYCLIVIVYLLRIILAIFAHVRHSKRFLRAAVVLLAVMPALAGTFIFRVVNGLETRRSGAEVYAAAFGNPAPASVHVRNYFYPVVPDGSLSIYFDACPQEVRRILAQQAYTVERRPNAAVAGYQWLKPADFTDTVLYCSHTESGRTQFMYIAADSSRVYYMDSNF